jgi:serine/threonine protein kinase
MEVSSGEIVGGRYLVEAALGSGGMAQVWRVRHTELDTLHALKVLHNTAPEIRERLVGEGRIQARLSHPNIVRVTDLVSLEGGGVGLVMDYVPGRDLRALLDEGRPPLEAGLALGAAILDGVACAHRQGLIHRDLKHTTWLEWLLSIGATLLVTATTGGAYGLVAIGGADVLPAIRRSWMYALAYPAWCLSFNLAALGLSALLTATVIGAPLGLYLLADLHARAYQACFTRAGARGVRARG